MLRRILFVASGFALLACIKSQIEMTQTEIEWIRQAPSREMLKTAPMYVYYAPLSLALAVMGWLAGLGRRRSLEVGFLVLLYVPVLVAVLIAGTMRHPFAWVLAFMIAFVPALIGGVTYSLFSAGRGVRSAIKRSRESGMVARMMGLPAMSTRRVIGLAALAVTALIVFGLSSPFTSSYAGERIVFDCSYCGTGYISIIDRPGHPANVDGSREAFVLGGVRPGSYGTILDSRKAQGHTWLKVRTDDIWCQVPGIGARGDSYDVSSGKPEQIAHLRSIGCVELTGWVRGDYASLADLSP